MSVSKLSILSMQEMVSKSYASTMNGPTSRTTQTVVTKQVGRTSPSCGDSDQQEAVREFQDNRHVFEAADEGWNFGFIPRSRPSPTAYSNQDDAPVAEEQKKSDDSESVISGISSEEQYKLFVALYAQYGHPAMERLKVAFAWLATIASATAAFYTESSVLGPAFVALALAVAVTYIIKPTGS